MKMDTIFALATAAGKAGVAIIRISGPEAFAAAGALCGAVPSDSRVLRRLRSSDGAVLDEALVLGFGRGHSFTGEDVVELHLHGSPAVQKSVLAELSAQPGLRHAEAGEFTRRAMGNGRLKGWLILLMPRPRHSGARRCVCFQGLWATRPSAGGPA